MKHLHAYWRYEYIEAPKCENKDDLFASLPKTENDRKSLIIFRGEHSYIVLNRFPYNAGHLLVVPYRAVKNLADLKQAERIEMFDLIVKSEILLKKALNTDGVNVGFNLGSAAGAGIPNHLHCHVVPRWCGDTNFMPIVGEARVLVQSLDEMWTRLKEELEKI